jgi:hypothetical protein
MRVHPGGERALQLLFSTDSTPSGAATWIPQIYISARVRRLLRNNRSCLLDHEMTYEELPIWVLCNHKELTESDSRRAFLQF